jgi:hypothetical protein
MKNQTCTMCSLHETREAHQREEIAELKHQLAVARHRNAHLKRKRDWPYFALFALALFSAYLVVHP